MQEVIGIPFCMVGEGRRFLAKLITKHKKVSNQKLATHPFRMTKVA